MPGPPGGFEITIDGVDYTPHVDVESISIDGNLAVMLDTCKFTVGIKGQTIYRPISGQEVIVTSNQGREFGGLITNVSESQIGVAGSLDYAVQTRDYSFLLDRRCAFVEYAQGDWTYDGIVKDLVARYGSQDGFTTNNVDPTFDAPYTRFDYQPTGQSINQLAQQAALTFHVDYFRDVHFYESEKNISPLPANTLMVDTATVIPDGFYGTLGVLGDLTIVEDITQLRNRIFLYGQNVTSENTYTDNFTGDASTTSFGLTYEPSHNLAANVSVTVGGVPYTVAADLIDGSPSSTIQDFTAYINFASQIVRFNVAPANGVAIVVAYKPMLPLVVMTEDPSAQRVMAARIGGSDDGTFEYAISDPTLSADTIDPAVARGQEQMAKYGLPHISGQFTSYLFGWQPGQYFVFNSTKRFNGELTGTTLYATKVSKKIVSHPLNASPLFMSTVSYADSIYVF